MFAKRGNFEGGYGNLKVFFYAVEEFGGDVWKLLFTGPLSREVFCEAKTEFNGTKMRPDAFVCIAKRVTVRGPVAVNSNTFGILCIFTWRLFLTY